MENKVVVNVSDASSEQNSTRKGQMKVQLKNENGFVLSKNFGFTIQEENGEVLAFDLVNHPQLGTTLLFGNQVFAMSFWSEEQLDKAMNMLFNAVSREKERRRL